MTNYCSTSLICTVFLMISIKPGLFTEFYQGFMLINVFNFFHFRHVFYQQVHQQFQEGELRIPDETQLTQISALATQAEHGDCTCPVTPTHSATSTHSMTRRQRGVSMSDEAVLPTCPCERNPCIPAGTEPNPTILSAITQCHSQLRGVSCPTAEYRMIQEVTEISDVFFFFFFCESPLIEYHLS